MIGIPELIILIVVFILIVLFIAWLIALIDILRSDFGGNNKIIWLLVVILLPFIGMIPYFVIGRKQKEKR